MSHPSPKATSCAPHHEDRRGSHPLRRNQRAGGVKTSYRGRCAVNTDLFNAFPSISGVFDSPDAPCDLSKHKVHIKLQSGVALRAAVVTGTVITASRT
ncbi:MAG: hypothetical protein LBL06_01785 [Treponema sp.]|nr:hypothetical protein [Treponema sp.]